MRVRPPVSAGGGSGRHPTRLGPASLGGPSSRTAPLPHTLVGGVGYRWQRDASFGLAVTDALADDDWPAEVAVEDLGYGALHVADDLRIADPPWQRVILVAAALRGRRPGTLHRRVWTPPELDPEDVHARIREAGGGVIDLDHLLVIGAHLDVWPRNVVVFELEPIDMEGGEGFSPAVQAGLDGAIERVRREALLPIRR